MSAWPMLGVATVVLGFALRANPVLVVAVAAVVTGLSAGMDLITLLEAVGTAFLDARYLLLILATIPVIALLEAHGLRERARELILRLRGATPGRLLIGYLGVRQLTSALGLTSLAGQAPTVRPLLAPMAEGATGQAPEDLPPQARERLRAMCAATDNVGLFFGEDIFIAFGAVLLMQGFFAGQGIVLEPLHIALWGIPTAICAFAIHTTRLLRFDARLAREIKASVKSLHETPPC